MKKNTLVCLSLLVCLFALTTNAQTTLKLGTSPKTINSSAALEVESTTKGFLPPRMTTAQRNALTPVKGLTIFNIDPLVNCVEWYDGSAWHNGCGETPPKIVGLNCAGYTTSGPSLMNGVDVPAGKTITMTYTSSNGADYNSMILSSGGVLGVTASLQAGTLSKTGGSLTLTITGKPTSAGTANFTITFGTDSCSFGIPVNANTVSGTFDCANPLRSGSLKANVPASGVSVAIAYTGGNGASYSAIDVASTGVVGLNAKAAAGSIASGSGTLVLTIEGMATTVAGGTASFTIPIGGISCPITFPVAAADTYVGGLTCGSAAFSPLTATATTAYTGTITLPYTNGNGVAYSAGSPINSTGVLGLTATLRAGTLANGAGGSLIYDVVGTPASNGTASFALSFGGKSCPTVNLTVNANPVSGTFDCANPIRTGTLKSNVPASGVSIAIAYTGGNGASYPAIDVAATGVTGTLRAKAPTGAIANGAGTLVLTIEGTATTVAGGTASFTNLIPGVTCTVTFPVGAADAYVGGLTCGSATFSPTTITSNTAYSGTLTVPYTGGNGAPYPAGSAISSTGVLGLTATLQAGTLTTSTGNLTYTVSGMATSAGTASFTLNFGGKSCVISKTVSDAPVDVYATCNGSSPFVYNVIVSKTGKNWMDRNLGASRAAFSPTDAQAYGCMYQWGRGNDGHASMHWTGFNTGILVNSVTNTVSGVDQPYAVPGSSGMWIYDISDPYNIQKTDWRSPINDDMWLGVNAINNPCPDGFRVPSISELSAEFDDLNGYAIHNINDAFNNGPASGFKIVSAGFLNIDGSTLSVGTGSLLYSSSVYSWHPQYVGFDTSSAWVSINGYRGTGMPVRCVKD